MSIGWMRAKLKSAQYDMSPLGFPAVSIANGTSMNGNIVIGWIQPSKGIPV